MVIFIRNVHWISLVSYSEFIKNVSFMNVVNFIRNFRKNFDFPGMWMSRGIGIINFNFTQSSIIISSL